MVSEETYRLGGTLTTAPALATMLTLLEDRQNVLAVEAAATLPGSRIGATPFDVTA
jgi:hypothetical protein